VGVVAVVLAAGGWLLTRGLETRGPAKPHMVVVSLDGLTATGHPALDRLAAAGVSFTRAYSQSNQPVLSHASLLSSRYPTHIAPLLGDQFKLPPDLFTLPKVLGMHGYRTAGFHGLAALDARHGFGTGFEPYVGEDHCGSLYHLAPAALRWIAENRLSGAPLFVWLQACDGLVGDGRAPLRAQHGGSVDDWLQQLVDGLPRGTVVVVTSAVGHDGAVNRDSIEAALHVPLIVAGVAGAPAGARSDDLVESIDVVPTLLDLAGIDVPGDARGRSQGEALGRPARGERPPRRRSVGEGTDFAAVLDVDGGLMVAGIVAGSAPMVAALEAKKDPRVIPLGKGDAGDLRAALLAVEKGSVALRARGRRPVDPELEKALREHGYW